MSFTLPSDRVSRDAIRGAVKEIHIAMSSAKDLAHHIKDIKARMLEEQGVKPENLQAMASLYHKENLQEVSDKHEERVGNFEILFPNLAIGEVHA